MIYLFVVWDDTWKISNLNILKLGEVFCELKNLKWYKKKSQTFSADLCIDYQQKINQMKIGFVERTINLDNKHNTKGKKKSFKKNIFVLYLVKVWVISMGSSCLGIRLSTTLAYGLQIFWMDCLLHETSALWACAVCTNFNITWKVLGLLTQESLDCDQQHRRN